MSRGRDKEGRNGERKKPIPSGALLPPELVLFIKEFEKLMNQLVANPELRSFGSEPRLYSFNITLGPEGKSVIKPITSTVNGLMNSKSIDLGDYTDVMVEGDEVTVVTRLDPHIKKAEIRASGKEMYVLVEGDEVIDIKLPVKVEEKTEKIKLRNGVLTAKLRKKKLFF